MRIYGNESHPCTILITPERIIGSDNTSSREGSFELKTESLSMGGHLPFFHLYNSLAAIAINAKGLVYVWKDIDIDFTFKYQIPLISSHEHITNVEFLANGNAVLGSSLGELYLLQVEALKACSFYFHPSLKSLFYNILSHTSPTSLTIIEKPYASEEIVKIHSKNSMLYVLTSKALQLWNFQDETKVEVIRKKKENRIACAHFYHQLISRKDVEQQVQSGILVHIPDHVSKSRLKWKLLDSDMIK